MEFDLGHVMDRPWGLAMVVLVLLVPRMLVRHRDPHAMHRIGGMRLALGYSGAIIVALAMLALAEALHLRPWVEAAPMRTARRFSADLPVVQYLLAALIAWLLAAYLVVPLAAWLGSYGRANGLLLAVVCQPVGLVLGVACSFAWPEPLTELPFTVASACSLMLAVALGFSIGAGLPLSVRLRARS